MSLASIVLRRVRGSTLVVGLIGGMSALALALVVSTTTGPEVEERRARAAALSAELALSDPALFTEARYTRNPSLADLHSPFQDGPASLEHFPTASLIVAPPAPRAGRMEIGEE